MNNDAAVQEAITIFTGDWTSDELHRHRNDARAHYVYKQVKSILDNEVLPDVDTEHVLKCLKPKHEKPRKSLYINFTVDNVGRRWRHRGERDFKRADTKVWRSQPHLKLYNCIILRYTNGRGEKVCHIAENPKAWRPDGVTNAIRKYGLDWFFTNFDKIYSAYAEDWIYPDRLESEYPDGTVIMYGTGDMLRLTTMSGNI